MTEQLKRSICIAPMLDKTDRHYRYFARLITRHALLYSEMITTGALLKGDADYHLKFSHEEHPLALQLGGSEPQEMAACARMAEDYGYDEVNINVGCPSDRVQSGTFGACLMAEPDLVAECVQQMQDAVSIPVTVKTRIGIDDRDSYDELCDFVKTVASAGCASFIIHARKAWLKGLSPKENREIPPLIYPVVYQIKRDFPQLEIILNGGVNTLTDAQLHLDNGVDGIMIGREAYNNPWLLHTVDQLFYGAEAEPATRGDILARRSDIFRPLLDYIVREQEKGTVLRHITRHILGLYQGVPGAKQWRRRLSDNTALTVDDFRQLLAEYSEN